MLPKFSVLLKLLKYSQYEQNALNNIFQCHYRNIVTTKSCTAIKSTNALIKQRANNKTTAVDYLKNIRHISSNNKEGDGPSVEVSDKKKSLKQKRKKKLLRRSYKQKRITNSQTECQQCKSIAERNTNTERLKSETEIKQCIEMKHKKDQHKAKAKNVTSIIKMSNNIISDISQSQLPPKKVHVEFMESQKLKDFNLKKSSPLEPIKSNNNGFNVINIKIEPLNYLNDKINQKSTSLIELPSKSENNISKEIKLKAEIKLKPTIKKLSLDLENKPNEIKTDKMNLDLPNMTHENRFSFQHTSDKKKHSLQQINSKSSPQGTQGTVTKTSNPDFSQVSTKFPKSSENIRILYQTHPQRKTKIKVPIEQTETPEIVQNVHQEKTKATKTVNELNDILARKGILFPTKPGKFLDIKITSKKVTIDTIEPFTTLRKSILYPTNNADSKVKKSLKQTLNLKNNEIKPSKETVSVQPMQVSTINNKLKPLPIIDTNLLNISTTKKELANEKIHIQSQKPKVTATLSTNKSTKFKGSTYGRIDRERTMEGDFGNKNARTSKFWRTLSITMLPFILGLTVYVASNIGAVEMFKHLPNSNPNEDQFPMRILSTLYGKRSQSQKSNLNDIECEEEDDDFNNLNDNKNKSEILDSHITDSRLDEA